MQRFFGIMPTDEIEKETTIKNDQGDNLIVQAGPHGWTLIYHEKGSSNCTQYEDNDASTEENFERALSVAKVSLGDLLFHSFF